MNYDVQTTNKPQTESKQPKNIRDVLYRRSDLSTFVVHLTRDKESLESIVEDWKIEAKSVWGWAKNKIKENTPEEDSQKCVCFTETPLEYTHLMIEQIKGRSYQPGPYGISITKKLARKKGCNPVWYVDMTPGQVKQWELSKAVDGIIHGEIANNNFEDSDIKKIAPFIEQMYPGANNDHPKEFWWEREWRHVGYFDLPNHVIILCPDENDNHQHFECLATQSGNSAKCVDPSWGLEKIIARLAGFDNGEIDIL